MKDKYVIKIKIDKEEELYNKFDKSRETLSDSFISYINDKIELSLKDQKIIFEVECDKDIDEEHLNDTFKKYINNQITLIDRKIKVNVIKECSLFILGFILLLVSIRFREILKDLTIEMISIISYFALWQAAESSLFENRELKERKIKLLKLLKVKVIEK